MRTSCLGKLRPAAALLGLALALGLMVPVRAQGPETASSLTVRIDGDRFIDDAGRRVILRGINAGGRSKLPPFLPFEPGADFDAALARYADAVAGLGFNVVRLLIIYEAAEPERGRYDEAYLARYDAMVRAFGRRGVRVFVDAHQDVFSRRFCGDGFPDWALRPQDRDRPLDADCQYWSLRYFVTPASINFDRFWKNQDGIQDNYVEFFRMLAKRYRDEPAVIGFEPINEPFPGRRGQARSIEWYRDLFALYERVGRAVHEADPRYLVLAEIGPAENQGAWTSLRPRPRVDNLVFAPHYYDGGTFGFAFSPGGDQWFMRLGLGKHLALARRWGAPTLATEYGISPLNRNAPDYIDELYEVFDQRQLSGTFWEASMSAVIWNHEITSIFNPDGSLRPGAAHLDRPFPRAVAGRIVAFGFERPGGVFRLRWEESAGMAAPTEVYLPARVYGDAPKIRLEPAGVSSFDAGARLLLVAASGKAGERWLEVRP